MTTTKKLLTTGICATILALTAAPAKADFISGEVFGSDKGTLIEVKGSTSIGDQPNTQYFTRVRRFRGYDNKNTSFMQNELSLGDWHGLRLLAQARLAGEQLIPQTGISYSSKTENISLYAALTSSIQPNTLPELLVLATVKIQDNIPLELEQFVSANQSVLKASSRAHLGYTTGKFTLGVAAEADYGANIPTNSKIGLYARLRSK